jgi:uncharacterized protein (TIGR03382 family)
MLSALAVGLALSLPSFPCYTPPLSQIPELRVPKLLPQLDQVGKAERDAVGTYTNMLTSTNFALKWGPTGGVNASDAESLLGYFEDAWAAEVVRMGYEAPTGSQTHLFNVYIGDTGDNTPSALGNGAYYYVDDAGWPMIVVSIDTTMDPAYAQSIPPHEFFHALEDRTGSYGYDETNAWYSEACSEWVVFEVVPDNPAIGDMLGGYALVPEYPVTWFDYPDTGAFLEYHQYGAFIFPYFLSQKVADTTLIKESWTEAGYELDPLVVLSRLLDARGKSLETSFGGFAAHNATWDYAKGADFEANIDYFADYYPEWDHRIAALVPSTGTVGGWIAPDLSTLPQSFGYNVIQMVSPKSGSLQVAFQGATAGSRGSVPRFQVTIVRQTGSQRTYLPLTISAAAGQLAIPDVGGETSIYLVVAAIADAIVSGETFDYRYQLEYVVPPTFDPPVDTSGDPDGGCASVPATPTAALFLALLLSRRRRPT